MRLPPIALLCVASLCSASDWTMYLGDLKHSSYRADENAIDTVNIFALQERWRVELGSIVSAAVSTTDGHLYFGDWSGKFYSVDSTTGQIVWSTFLGVAPQPDGPDCMPGVGVVAQAAVDGDTVYAAGGDSAVYALDRQTGSVRWRVQLADPATGSLLWSSVMLSRGSLYVGIASLDECPNVRGGIARIPLNDPQNPLLRYTVPAETVGAGIWSTPAIDEEDGLVYVTTGNADHQDADRGEWGSAMLVLDADTLEIRNHFFLPIGDLGDADWGTSPILFDSGGEKYVAASGKTGALYVLKRPSLELAWSHQIAISCETPEIGCGSVSTPAFDGFTLYAGSGTPPDATETSGAVYAFDPVSGDVRWTYPARAPLLAPVTVVPGLVFAPTTDGLVVLEAESGAELWNDAGGKAIYAQPVVSNGVLYTAYAPGFISAYAVESMQPSEPLIKPRHKIIR